MNKEDRLKRRIERMFNVINKCIVGQGSVYLDALQEEVDALLAENKRLRQKSK